MRASLLGDLEFGQQNNNCDLRSATRDLRSLLGDSILVDLVQLLIAGITVGVIYGLIALGFSIICNASDVINLAQGEYVMIGGMATVSLLALGFSLPIAILLAIICAIAVGIILEKIAIEPALGDTTNLIIITIGLSILLRGAALLLWGKDFHSIPAFSGVEPIRFLSASVVPQTFWILGVTLILVVALWIFFSRSKLGTAFRAVSDNATAAKIVGIEPRFIITLAFGLSAAVGAIAGILVAPVTLTSYEVGIMLGLKGFSAAILGGLQSPFGAFLGGIVFGVIETLAAGYITSAYKDAISFLVILLVIFVRPQGFFGGAVRHRV